MIGPDRRRNMPYIEIQNVEKTIGKVSVLRGVNLEIEKGTINGFVGPNGSGKTMLLRLIAGYLKPTRGKLIKPSAIKQGVIIENPAFIDEFSGFDNLSYLASIREIVGPDEIRATMRLLNLSPEDSRKVKVYSLGMKQKLAFAQAIMERPDILILDEPTRGMDDESVKTVYSIIKKYREDGVTAFIASHNREDIETLCDKVYTIQNGNVIFGFDERN